MYSFHDQNTITITIELEYKMERSLVQAIKTVGPDPRIDELPLLHKLRIHMAGTLRRG